MTPTQRCLLKCIAMALSSGAVVSWGATPTTTDIFVDTSRSKLTLNVEAFFDIQSQRDLMDALYDWAAQCGLQIVIPESPPDAQPHEKARVNSPRVRGRMSAREALRTLLAGSGLTYGTINARTVVIRPIAEGSVAMEEHAFFKPQFDSVPNPVIVSVRPEVVLVTGSRLRPDIRTNGSVETPAPVITLDRKRLDETGASSAAELMNFITQQPYRTGEVKTENSAQYAETRGLGFDTTLVLINGRRTIPTSTSVSWNAFDLNTLPLAAVESVEVLSDSASAVYGADAIGGVINFILKEDIPRPSVDVHYGSAQGGAEERRASLSAGYSNERLRTALVFENFDRGTLLGAERDRWSNQDFRRFGGDDYRASTSNPGNVTSLTSANLPGLPSRFAAVPAGSTGIGLTPADFLVTAEQRNFDSLYRYWSLNPKSERRSVVASADLDLTNAVNLFGELFYADDFVERRFEPATRTLVVPATNPFNPFGVDVSVGYLFDGLPYSYQTNSERVRVVAGARGTLRDWDWELSLVKVTDEGSSLARNVVNMAKVNAALAETDPSRALNVFRDGPGGDASLLASLVTEPTVRPYKSEATQGSAVLRGTLITLPAGDAALVIGGEWVMSDVLFRISATQVDKGRSAGAGFGELRVPLVSADMQIPAIQKLSLTLASRYDRYSDFGDSLNSQYGLVWVPVSDLVLRVSFGTAFRAPSLFELYASRGVPQDFPLPDPLRNNEISLVSVIGGGNPNLEAVEASSLVAGFDWTLTALQGLKFSASYWRIKMDKRVSTLPFNVLAENWEQFPGRAVRAERTPEDIASGLPGKLLFLDLSRINFGTTETAGVDLSAAYSVETHLGDFHSSLSATWIDKYQIGEIPGMAALERLSIADATGSVVRWKTVATLGWERNGLGLSATARYTSAYADADLYRHFTGRTIPAQTLVDMQGSVDINQLLGTHPTWFPRMKLTVGVSNLFNEEPSFAEIGERLGYDASQGDLRRRFEYLRLSAQF